MPDFKVERLTLLIIAAFMAATFVVTALNNQRLRDANNDLRGLLAESLTIKAINAQEINANPDAIRDVLRDEGK